MEFLEVPLFDDDIYKLIVRFGINVFFLTFFVTFAIYPNQRQREFAFTAVMMNVTVFFICFTLKKLELSIGMALGLFAIFGVLRYRTDAIRAKEMTYLFIVIGLAVINSLSNKKTSYTELALVNVLIFGATMLKEWFIVKNGYSETASAGQSMGNSKEPKANAAGRGKTKEGPAKKLNKFEVETDNLELLGSGQNEKLIAHLQERTGLEIAKVQIRKVDLSNQKVLLTVWHQPDDISNPTDVAPGST